MCLMSKRLNTVVNMKLLRISWQKQDTSSAFMYDGKHSVNDIGNKIIFGRGTKLNVEAGKLNSHSTTYFVKSDLRTQYFNVLSGNRFD